MINERNSKKFGFILLVLIFIMFFIESQQDLGIYGVLDVFKYSIALAITIILIYFEKLKKANIKTKPLFFLGTIGIIGCILYVLFVATTQFSFPDGVSMLVVYLVYIAFLTCSFTSILIAMLSKTKLVNRELLSNSTNE